MKSITTALARNFLGGSPRWYKVAIVAFLVLNPIVLLATGPFVAGWVLVLEFIFTLAMALKCYPLLPGGLLAIEALALGMTTPDEVYEETVANFPVILLLMFMVAGIYFMRELLLVVFTKLFLRIRSKIVLSVAFMAITAVFSAFLDALTVAAVVLAVLAGFYTLYHRHASGRHDEDHYEDDWLDEHHRADLERFRSFLRSLLMHAAIGTAAGGVATLVGEPQNLLIGETLGFDFIEFMVRVAPVSLPVFLAALLVCVLLETTRWFGYGQRLPDSVANVMREWDRQQSARRDPRRQARLIVQGVTGVLLVVGLALHVAEVGIVGLGVIVVATAFAGVTDEKAIGHAFEEALPFTALLVTFFAIVAVIHAQGLFAPVTDLVLAQDGQTRLMALFGATGALSAISDNVFVATVYMSELQAAAGAGVVGQGELEQLGIAVNIGTNIPSIATPNGQAAFLFILTSSLAPLIRLGYVRMLWMALPYTIALTAVAFAATALLI